MTAEEIIRRMEKFEADRSNENNQFQQCADYGMPNSNQITQKHSPGQPKPDLFDTTAEDSNIQLAAGLYSYMFPTDSRAFVLKTDDPELAENDEAKQWFERTTAIIHEHLVSSNFRQAFFEFLKSLGCFGPACLYEEKGKKSPITFICHHIAGYYIALNSDRQVDTVYRPFEYTARQAVQEFKKYKDTLGEKLLKAYNDPKQQDKKFRFIHAVFPREDADKPDDPKGMPWASSWVNRDEKKLIYESGYPEMPYQVSMFDRDPLEVYGRSPMMKSLPDIKMVNHMQKTRIKGWEKQVDPPVILPDDGSIWPLATQPAGVIYKRAGGDSPEWFEFKGDLREMEKAILSVQQKIQKGFYLDMFDPLVDRQNMTATEVMARVEQKMRFLTPIIGRLQSDLFNPMIHRIIGILSRQTDKNGQGLLPPMPIELAEKEYSIMYLGRLALSMRTLETEGLAKTLADWAPMGELDRSWLDNLDKDIAFRDSARNNGMPATWLKNIKVRDAERQALARQQQAQEALATATEASKGLRNVSKAPEEGSITKELIDAAT